MGDEGARERLTEALAEQARLSEQYEQAVGTPAELSAFARLQAANLRVAVRNKTARFARVEKTA
jgi:hypothetical protein